MAWTTPKTFTATILSVSDMNTYLRDNTAFLKENIDLDAAAELTISSGVVTFTKSFHDIDTESDASEDDLDTINVAEEGRIIFLRAENAARTVILKDGTGNLVLGGDIYLDSTDKIVALFCDGTNWLPLAFYDIIREFVSNSFEYPAPGTDWTPQLEGAGLGASLTSKKVWLRLNLLKIGDQIISYKIVGDAVEVTALTLDCKLVRINKADPITTTDVAGGGITQIDADGNFDSEAVLTDPEVVATDKQYALELQGTTGASDAITVIGAEVKIIRLA